MTFILAKPERNYGLEKETASNKKLRVMAPRSKVRPRSNPLKAHVLDVTFIPIKNKIDPAHDQGTTGRKKGNSLL